MGCKFFKFNSRFIAYVIIFQMSRTKLHQLEASCFHLHGNFCIDFTTDDQISLSETSNFSIISWRKSRSLYSLLNVLRIFNIQGFFVFGKGQVGL